MTAEPRALLEVEGLTKHFPVRQGMLGLSTAMVRAVDGISFDIGAGQTLGLVGESGCGKTTTSKMILGLERPTGGAIRFQGEDVLALGREALKRYRKAVQAVFQDPYASLDPRMRVGTIVAEPLDINERPSAPERRRRVLELLDLVGLPERAADLFPTSSRAASASAWPSRARSRCRRGSSSWTSPSPPSTSRSARRS